MSKEAYQQKISAQIDEQNANLDRIRAQAKGKAADARLETEAQISSVEKKIAGAKAQLAKLGEASEDAWEDLKGDVEKAWDDLSTTAKNFYEKISK